MAYDGIQALVDSLTVQKSDLTNTIGDAANKLIRASRNSSGFAKEFAARKDAARLQYASGSKDLEEALDKIDDEKEVLLSEITALEDELNANKKVDEGTLEGVTTQLQTWFGVLKQNIQDTAYAGAGNK